MKNKQDWILENYGWCWAITIIFILVLVFVEYRMINHDSFTIYKDECVNETYQIGYFCGFSYKFNNLNDTMTINFTLKPEPLNKDSLLKSQEECRRIEQEAYINSMSLEYPNTLETWNNPIYETKCEKVGVEEIETGNLKVEVNMNKNWIIVKGQANLKEICGDDLYKPAVNNSNCKIIKEIISKKDLTKEWLDENCFKENCIYGVNRITTCCDEKNECRNSNGKIQRYKCFENYFIEVD